MPIYRYECDSCGEFEATHGMNDRLNRCVGCGGLKIKKLVPTAIAFKCPRVASERAPAHAHWMATEGERRMRLPDGHPDKLVPVRKSDDLAHGVATGIDPKIEAPPESRIADHIQEWKSLGSPSVEKVSEMAAAGQI
jgi:putative FmdB family regulatory protein